MKNILCLFLTAVLICLPCLPLTGCSASLIDTVLEDLPVATDIALSIVNIVDPAVPAPYMQDVTQDAGKVSADLKLIASLITEYQSNLAAAPNGVFVQINAALTDCQTNLAAILNAVGVDDPKITSAVAAAVASVKQILNDAALLVKNSVPTSVSARLFFGVGMPGVNFLAVVPDGQAQIQNAAPKNPSGKSARQVAREYNQKIAKDFPRAQVHVSRMHVLGLPIPLTGR